MTYPDPDPLDLDLLTTLAWAAPLTTAHLHRIVAPWSDISTVRKHLRWLLQTGMVECHRQVTVDTGSNPRRLGSTWAVTSRGFTHIPDDDRRPERPALLRRALLAHDLVIGDLLAAAVSQSRGVLSMVQMAREARLDPTRRRPICDALIVLASGAEPTVDRPPWSGAPLAPGERRIAWAVEVDRDTEPLATIAEKGRTYRQAHDTSGRTDGPVPLWLVPTDRRGTLIWRHWAAVWPEGHWLMATQDRIDRQYVAEYCAGEQRMVGLLEAWR